MAAHSTPDDVKSKIRKLWDEGVSAAQIGVQLGRTKNSVVGIAHRMGLARPSPINRTGGGMVKSGEKPAARPQGNAALTVHHPRAIISIEAVKEETLQMPKSTARPKACCWPIGEPRAPGFRFCEAPGEPGQVYCRPHRHISVAGYSEIKWYPERDWELLRLHGQKMPLWEVAVALDKMPGVKTRHYSELQDRLRELEKMGVAA